MTTRARRAAPGFTLASYSSQLEEFVARQSEARYRQLAGLEASMGLVDIHAYHAGLFDTSAIDWLRGVADGEGDDAAQGRELLAFATRQHLAADVAEVTDRVVAAEATAVIMWRGEAIPYGSAWNRATDIASRGERNALASSYLEAVEAINPLRQERFERMCAAVRRLGYADVPDMVRATAGFDPTQLAGELRAFLADSETVYYAAQRRTMAEIDIEHGDGARVDLDRVLRGAGWDSWFPPRGLLPALRRTLAGVGIDFDGQRAIQLDTEQGDRTSARALSSAVRVPADVRLAIQPHGGWGDYAAMLHEAGKAEHYVHVAADLPAAFRLLGDDSLTEGYGLLFQTLLGQPRWLMEQLGMPEAEARAFADFLAFWQLAGMRQTAAGLIYELYLHSGVDAALAREQYAGMLGLTLGVREPAGMYLASASDDLHVARHARGAMVAGSLSAALRARVGDAWWHSAEAGDVLRRSWSQGRQWNAEDVVARLGYDRLDWRPVLRQIRTRLIGEMSGYGGPNITTRAGTRKV